MASTFDTNYWDYHNILNLLPKAISKARPCSSGSVHLGVADEIVRIILLNVLNYLCTMTHSPCKLKCITNIIIYIYIYLASEQDTLRGNTIWKSWMFICYICVDVHMSFCTLTLVYFYVRFVFDPVPNFTKQNPPV